MKFQLLESLALPGDAAKPNEDAFGQDELAAVVIDGATPLGDGLMPGPSDAAWIAGSIISDHWLPASPATGKLDAFVWRRPDERLSADGEADDAIFRPVLSAAEPPILIEKPCMTIAGPEPENPGGGANQESARAGARGKAAP